MSRHEKADRNRKVVRAFKQALNPATGHIFTYEEIGRLLGVTRQAAFQYAGDTRGLCPGCLKPLTNKLPKIK